MWPFDGWTKRALRAGVREAGLPADEADLLFPLGTVDMIETFCDLADRQMEEAAAALPQCKLPARVRAVIALRLEQNRPYKEAIRRALAVLALPAERTGGGGMHRADDRRDLACGRRPFGGFQLVYQAGDPGGDLQRDNAVLAARHVGGRCGDVWRSSTGDWPGWRGSAGCVGGRGPGCAPAGCRRAAATGSG